MTERGKHRSVPTKLQPVYDQIVGFTDSFCHQYLTEEYAALCRKMASTLSRKRPSPLLQGRPQSWACGILYALGRVNFLFDPSQTPHIRASDLCRQCGVSQNTASAKAKQILDSLNIMLLDPAWSLPSKLEDNPMAWLIMVNGYIVDARDAPREIQEEAYRKGLIPYIPLSARERRAAPEASERDNHL